MKEILFKSGIALLLLAALTGCKKKFQENEQTENGPQITVNSYSQTAVMGGKVNFSVAISDSEFELSTLKATLLFDETPVDDITIRTKEAGTYTGTLQVPFLANIPDGTASLQLVAQNTGLGKTTLSKDVAISRPVFAYLTLTDETGHEYRMEHGEGFNYAVTADFPSEVKATITTPPVSDGEAGLTFGFLSGAIALGGTEPIPFSNGVAGNYTISFNTLTFEGAPFTKLSINGANAAMVDANNYAAIINLTQNGEVKIEGYVPGFQDWTIDPDFLEATSVDGTYKFLAMDGLYRFNIGVADKFFKVEAMSSETEYAKLSEDCSGTLWLIGGDCYGKPAIWSYSWNPEQCGLCFAQVSRKVHQLTFVAGVQLKTNAIDFKFFGQKTWGIEFGGANTTDSGLITIGASDGNIHLAEGIKLDIGGIYRLTVDLNAASVNDNKITGAMVHFEKIGQNEVESPKIMVNGVELTQLSVTDYSGVVDFTKDAAITVSGIDDIATYYFDPDYLYFDGSSAKFAAASGLYTVQILGGNKDIRFKRMKDAGNEATIAEHALWLMGWGVASPSMEHAQFGWTPGAAYCMAEIADHVYQFSGKASDGEHDTTVGTRFRNDYISCKYFGQDGWGSEKGKIFGEPATVQLTTRAATLLKDAGNIELVDGITLEPGATYVLTIDLSVSGVETIDFYKK